MDSVGADERVGWVALLLLHVQRHHRFVQVQKLPSVSLGCLLLQGNDALHVVILMGKDVVVERRGLVVGRRANHHRTYAFQALQLLLAKRESLPGLLQLLAGEGGRVGAVVLVVAGVVHAEGEGQDGGVLREHVVVEAGQYLLRRVAAYPAVRHPQAHPGEVRHVVEPDVRVVVPAVGDAVAYERHAVALLERCNALCQHTWENCQG